MNFILCQCPLGLVPHCYGNLESSLQQHGTTEMCQCPLGLVPHCYPDGSIFNELRSRECQCPLGLVPHCYLLFFLWTVINELNVSMPSRASTSLLQYPFKNLGFMRFPEPVFAGICQNILTVTHFHAC